MCNVKQLCGAGYPNLVLILCSIPRVVDDAFRDQTRVVGAGATSAHSIIRISLYGKQTVVKYVTDDGKNKPGYNLSLTRVGEHGSTCFSCVVSYLS